MKILVVGNYFYPEHTGGVEIVSHNLVKYYKEFGCDVRWMAADVPPKFRAVGDGDIPIRAWNYAEERLGFPSPVPVLGDIGKIIKGVKWSDVIHLQDSLYPINIVVFIVSKLLRKPVLITQYAKFIPYKQIYKRWLQTVAYHTIGRLMFGLADRVVFITKNVLDNMRYINPEKLKEVIPLGVDTDFYFPVSIEERKIIRERLSIPLTIPVILFVGRLVERKGIHLIRPLVKKHKEWHWVFVGRPDDFNPREWNEPNLAYYENAPEVLLKELYSSSDILIHPSIGEGVTLIVSESLSSGTPVIISKDSLYEVDERDRGVFVPVSPVTDEIEKALISSLADMSQLQRKSVLCREYALNRLSWRKMASRYLEILGELTIPKRVF